MTFVTLLLAHALLLSGFSAPPFGVGETLRYDAKLGYFPVGTASISLSRTAQERGTAAYVFTLAGQGGPPGWRVRYDLTSWVDRQRFNSLRFHRKLVQAGKVQEHEYLILPDSARYQQIGVTGAWVAPADPLDELAFLYFLRTESLQPGRSYSYSRYFKTGYNPIEVSVAGAKQSVSLPDGKTVSALAVQVTSRGMIMKALLTDDAQRLPVQLEVPLPFGVVVLQLVEYQRGR
jgi:hypothetical protein